jgi:hypothetical protein
LAKTEGKRRRVIPRRRAATPAHVARPAQGARLAATEEARLVVGSVARCDDAGVWVEVPGRTGGPVLARAMLPAGGLPLQVAPAPGQPVVLMIQRARASAPVLLGLLQPLGRDASAAARPSVRARIDGRLELDARDEIVLRCGEATIVLRANGRVVVRGAYVETRAKGTNRIKGGAVSIN